MGKKKKSASSQERLTERDKIALEKQLVSEGKILPRAHYAPRGRLRSVIAFCLAFFLGIVVGIGGVVGAGLYAGTTMKIGDVFSMMGADPNALISEEYAEKSILDLGQDILGTEFTNLESIGKYTPIVRNTFSEMFGSFGVLGVSIDVDTFMRTDFSELGSFFQNDVLFKIELGKALGVGAASDPLMLALCYGKEGVDYDVNEAGEIAMRDGKTPTMISDLSENASGLIGGLTIGDLLNVDGTSSSLMQAIADWSVEDLKNTARINRLRIRQIIQTDDASSSLMKAIADWRIGDLTDQSKLDGLLLGDVIPVTEPGPDGTGGSARILLSLKNTPIGEIGTAIDTLPLSGIIDAEALAGNKILRHLQSSTVKTLTDDLQALTVGDVFADEVYSFMDVSDGSSYAELLRDYESHKGEAEYNQTDHRPKNSGYTASQVTEYRVRRGTSERLEEGYFTRTGAQYTALGADEAARVSYDAEIARELRQEESSASHETPYYLIREHVLTPEYGFGVIDFSQDGAVLPLPEGASVEETGGGDGIDCDYLYTVSDRQFPVYEDDFGFYYRDAEGKRVDLERFVTGYETESGEKLTVEADGVKNEAGETVAVRTRRTDGGTVCFTEERAEVFRRYFKGSTTYGEEETESRFEYDGDDAAKPLERYLDGVWYLLLSGDEGEPRTDTPVLELDGLVTGVSEKIVGSPLWELYFHGLLSANPFVELATEITLHAGTESQKTVKNLNEVTVVESIDLVKQLNALRP